MTLKYCQNPDCHTYKTNDRLKGTKGNKTYQTRRRSNFYYGRGNFCDRRCMEDWVAQYVEQALDHFGRTTEPKHLTEENAWIKDYDWRSDDEQNRYYFINGITREQRIITREQYEDRNYTLNIS
jgi:3-phenylpropionate/cinnamic acid dioxygenase small subunit